MKASLAEIRFVADRIRLGTEMMGSWLGNRQQETLVAETLVAARTRALAGKEPASILMMHHSNVTNAKALHMLVDGGYFIIEAGDDCELVYPTVKLIKAVDNHLARYV